MTINMMQVICAVFILTVGSFCSGESETCQPFEMKSNNLNKQLVGHSVSEISGFGHKECVEECMSLSVCKSTDYFRPKKTCKLNDVDSSSVDISEFRSLNGAIFSDISEWPSMMVGACGSRPCAKLQRCVEATDNFRCLDITCKNPSIVNGKLMLSAPDNDRFLDTATVQCRKGYIPNILSVKCQASGSWQKASCVPGSSSPSTSKLSTTASSSPVLPTTTSSTARTSSLASALPTAKALPATAIPTTMSSQAMPTITSSSVTSLSTLTSSSATGMPTTTASQPTTTTSAPVGCSIQSGEYTGSLSYTTGGYTCQRWDTQSPHAHGYWGDYLFPDSGASAAENYCRALGEVYLWCYTTDVYEIWDYCTKPAEVCQDYNYYYYYY